MAAGTGIGVVLNPTLLDVLAEHPQAVDYVEVIPETFWTDRGRSATARYEPVAAAIAGLGLVAERYPLAIHGIGLSVGTATSLDERHVRQVRRFADAQGIERVSEHLGFSRASGRSNIDRHVGVGFPLPCDRAVLAWMIPRVEQTMDMLDRPIIWENGVHHTPYVDEDMTEPIFINRLAEATGCGMLLDLHNLYVDHRNGGPPPDVYLDQLDLDHVREIHVAGGSTVGRAYTDSHAGPCPEEVWRLLADVLPECRSLEGVTFEYHQSYFPRLGVDGVVAELATARRIWDAARPERHVA
jgi:uncharacterized protein (UPF0276 family)